MTQQTKMSSSSPTLVSTHKQNLQKSFKLLKSHACLVADFTLQWQDLEDHLCYIHNQIESKLNSQSHQSTKPIETEPQKHQNPENFKNQQLDLPQKTSPENQTEKITVSMKNGIELISYVNERLKDEKMLRGNLVDLFNGVDEPGKLILEALGEYLKGNVSSEVGVLKRSCVLLLEEFGKLREKAEPKFREEAMRMAVEWRGKIRVVMANCLEIRGFLLLLIAFGLVDEFGYDEIVKLFSCILTQKDAPELFRALGFADKASASDKMSGKRLVTSASLKMREKRQAKRQKGEDSQEKLLRSAIAAGSTPHFSKPTKEKTLLVIPASLPACAPTTEGASSSRAPEKTQTRPPLPESGRPENQGDRSSFGSQKQAGKKAEEHPYFKRHVALMKKYYESEKTENVLVSKKRSQANWANFVEEMIIQASIVMMRAREEMIKAAKEVDLNKKKVVELAKKVEEFLSSAEDLKKLAEQRKAAQEEAEARLSVVEEELASVRQELSVKTAAYDQNYCELIVAKSEAASCKSEVAKLQMELSTAKASVIQEFMASDSYRDFLDEEYAAAENDYREMIAGAGLDLAALDAYILSQGEVPQDASIEQPVEQVTGPTEVEPTEADQRTPAKSGASAEQPAIEKEKTTQE